MISRPVCSSTRSVQLHHWLEHKVIHYLSHRKRFGSGHEGVVTGGGTGDDAGAAGAAVR